MNDCGCEVGFLPCEGHAESIKSGEESVRIEIHYDTKYSRFSANQHNVDLERVQRIELGIDIEPMDFDENTLADMLQRFADDRPMGEEAFALRAVANALRGNDPNHQLVLRQTKRGKWKSPSDEFKRKRQHIAWIRRLGRLQSQGWQKDAAVHRIAETTGNSVSKVYAGIAEEREWQDNMKEYLAYLDSGKKFKPSNEPSPK